MAAARQRRAKASRKVKNAEYQRRWRARQHPHKHEVVARVPVCDAVVAMLIDTGWLNTHEATDATEIGRAIGEMLKRAARDYQRKP